MTPHYRHPLGNECPLNLLKKELKVPADILPYLGFKHNMQSLKNAMQLEKNYGVKWLDLANFTLYEIQAHSSQLYN
jgi:hypothetical protein